MIDYLKSIFTITLLGPRKYHEKIIKQNQQLEKILKQPELHYDYKHYNICSISSIELKHEFLDIPYILSKLNHEQIEINDLDNIKIRLKNQKIEFYLDNKTLRYFVELNLSEGIFNETTEFENKKEITEFIYFIKNEIEKDLNKL